MEFAEAGQIMQQISYDNDNSTVNNTGTNLPRYYCPYLGGKGCLMGESFANHCFLQIMSGINYIHSKGMFFCLIYISCILLCLQLYYYVL